MLFSEMVGHPVVAADTARTLGSVTGVVLAGSPARVTGLRMGTGGGDALLVWEEIGRCGSDAVMVDAQAQLRRPDSGPGADPMGRVVLTDGGVQLGFLTDGEFDADDGRLVWLETAAERLAGDRLIGAGDFAVVVAGQRADREPPMAGAPGEVSRGRP